MTNDCKSRCCCGLKGWLLLWTLFIVAEAALLANNAYLDTLAWRTTRWVMGDQDMYKWGEYKKLHAADADAPFYARVDPPLTRVTDTTQGPLYEGRLYHRTEILWRVLRDLGEPMTTVILFFVVCIYDQRRRWRAGAILASGTIAAGLLGTLVRITTGRFRPNADIALEAGRKIFNEGGNYWQLFRGFHEGSDLSFPSGHATLAFATAAVLTYLSPRGKGLFLTIAAGTALSRVVMQAHFYSDILLGSVVGWTVGWFVTRAMDRFLCPSLPSLNCDAAV